MVRGKASVFVFCSRVTSVGDGSIRDAIQVAESYGNEAVRRLRWWDSPICATHIVLRVVTVRRIITIRELFALYT